MHNSYLCNKALVDSYREEKKQKQEKYLEQLIESAHQDINAIYEQIEKDADSKVIAELLDDIKVSWDEPYSSAIHPDMPEADRLIAGFQQRMRIHYLQATKLNAELESRIEELGLKRDR